MTRFEFVDWLVKWLFQQDDFTFEWDQGNSAKSAKKHGIDLEYAEQLFRNKDFLVPLGIQTAPAADEPRFGALGMDLSGRKL